MDKTETKEMEGEITTLKPCPFCGGEAKITQIKSNGFMIKCTRCLIQKRQKVLHYPIEWLKSKMIEDWNTRSELQKAKEEIANHIATNSLLLDSDGEADLANKIYQLTTELSKTKELNGELVNYLKRIMTREIFKEHFNIEQVEELIKKSES